jgi:hypothetical protein
MRFLAEADLVENECTKRNLTWGHRCFVFWLPMGAASVFKITQQEMTFQTAEEHYALEERRAR